MPCRLADIAAVWDVIGPIMLWPSKSDMPTTSTCRRGKPQVTGRSRASACSAERMLDRCPRARRRALTPRPRSFPLTTFDPVLRKICRIPAMRSEAKTRSVARTAHEYRLAADFSDPIHNSFSGRKQVQSNRSFDRRFSMTITAIPAVPAPSPAVASPAVARPGEQQAATATPASFGDAVASSVTPARQPPLAPVSAGVGRIIDLSA